MPGWLPRVCPLPPFLSEKRHTHSVVFRQFMWASHQLREMSRKGYKAITQRRKSLCHSAPATQASSPFHNEPVTALPQGLCTDGALCLRCCFISPLPSWLSFIPPSSAQMALRQPHFPTKAGLSFVLSLLLPHSPECSKHRLQLYSVIPYPLLCHKWERGFLPWPSLGSQCSV